MFIFMIIYFWILLIIRSVWGKKLLKKHKFHRVFVFENRSVYEIMWGETQQNMHSCVAIATVVTRAFRVTLYVYWLSLSTLCKADQKTSCGMQAVNPLTPELNPSAQRCLTRFFTGDFASWTVHFVNICVKNQQMQQLFIQFIDYVW
jgi:hypothetical protein